MPQLLKFCYSFEPTDGWPNATKCEDPSHWDGGARRGRVSDQEPGLPSPHTTPPHRPPPPSSGAWLPPAAFELLTEKYAPPECGADGEKAMVANKVLARSYPHHTASHFPFVPHPTTPLPTLTAFPLRSVNKVLALVARKFPAMCKAVRENA